MQILSSRAPVKVLIKVDLTKVSSPCAGLEISEFGISLKGAKFEISKLLNGSKFMFNIHKYNYRQNQLHCIYWIFQIYVSESAMYVAEDEYIVIGNWYPSTHILLGIAGS